ncbi:hypothetical protein RRF57_012502 [Xylaria bambusicola]|uniref:Cytochrome P450 monooxygenase n=1 Tax=Xylaria bambusicola TaxID=326684 RepID=A0AAN7UPV2_9PEZI
MTDILYGGPLPSDLKAELDSLVALREQLWSRMIQGGLTRFSLNQYLPTKTRRNLRDFKRRWAALNDRAYAIACMTQTQSAIVSLYGKVMNGNVEKDQVLQTIDEMLFANLDVTIGGLSWSLLFLAAHKDIQVKLWQEIKEAKVGPGVATRGWDDYIQSSSTLLAASILEAARLKPLAAFSVPQSAPTHRTVKGFHIPRGTNIIVDVHALNIENPFWGPDGDTYRPERFLKDCKLSDLRYNFWRFGFGPRQCLGKFIVDLIIRVVVATLVSEYNLGFTDITHWDKHPSTWILHPDTEIRCDKIIAKG